MPAIAAHLRTRVEFQSAPGREAGRCRIRLQAQGFIARFQSAPGREAGRCNGEKLTKTPVQLFQSAPGREAGRCRMRSG